MTFSVDEIFDATQYEPRQGKNAVISAINDSARAARAQYATIDANPSGSLPQSSGEVLAYQVATAEVPGNTPSGWFPVYRASDFHGKPVPPQSWHVPHWFVARNVNTLGGEGAAGKSLLAMQLAVSTALGTDWLGMAVERGGVLYLSAEDDIEEDHRRLDRIMKARRRELSELTGLLIADASGLDAVLAIPSPANGLMQPTHRFDELRRLIKRERPRLLVLDNLADVFGGDEIKKGHSRHFISMLRGLAIQFDLTVLLLAHPSQSGMASGKGTSGNVAWNNSVRSRLYLTRAVAKDGSECDPSIRELTVMKANYAANGQKLTLRYNDGCFDVVQAVENDVLNQQVDEAFLTLLTDFERANRNVSDSPGSNYAPKLFAEHQNANGFRKEQFRAALERLVTSGKIEVVKYGPQSSPKKRLAIVTNNLFEGSK